MIKTVDGAGAMQLRCDKCGKIYADKIYDANTLRDLIKQIKWQEVKLPTKLTGHYCDMCSSENVRKLISCVDEAEQSIDTLRAKLNEYKQELQLFGDTHKTFILRSEVKNLTVMIRRRLSEFTIKLYSK